MRAAPAGVGHPRAGATRRLVDGRVVRVFEAVLHRVGVQFPGNRRPPRAPRVEYLHALRVGVNRDDERVVPAGLDVPPRRCLGWCRQPSEEDRVLRVGDVNESRFVSLEGFLDAKIMVEILRRLGDEPLRDELERDVVTRREFEFGVSERVTFAEDSRLGLQQVYYTVVEDGRFVTLDDWQARFP